MPQCVYCRKTSGKNLFTREHVIPEAFGKFTNNFTLLSEVCGECNQYFGDKLEIVLARGSYEAIARIEQEISPPEGVENLIQGRIDISLSSANEEKGLVLAFVEREGRLSVEPQPQVRFSSKLGDGFFYVTNDELNDPAFDLPPDANLSDIAILANSNEMFEMVSNSLAGRGIELVRTYDEDIRDRIKGEPWVKGQVMVDRIILRTIAKICFNYLTYIHGTEFALRKELNPIREFIRQENSSLAEIVSVKNSSILKYDFRAFSQTNGHLVTIDWPPLGQHIFGQVSLFNIITYQVMLSNNCKMVWRDISSGHHFNIKRGRFINLVHTEFEFRHWPSNKAWCALKAIVCKGCKPDRSDHQYMFLQPHPSEMATHGTSWHKVSRVVKSISCPAGYSCSLAVKSLLVFPPYFV